MTFDPGTRLGPYEILSAIGAGGMGEVYRARDTRLGRDVAIKVLPATVALDRERMQRFDREARVLAGLNHPNIITIYEIGQTDGRTFIATEFVEGHTLRWRLTREHLPIDALLEVTIQTATALAAAHAAGVIHRDIKPDNLMLRPDGYVKVLDFGLAKLTEPPGSATDTTLAPTRMPDQTEAGVVMGTVHYMSPEQARGLNVDARTDIFSLGVVLYEMVTERQPFDGTTPHEVAAAILHHEPAPLARYARDVPPELERIVTKALRKDREVRYQNVRDLALDLQSLRKTLDGSLATSPMSGGPAHRTRLGGRRRTGLLTLAGLLVVIAAGLGYLFIRTPPVLAEKDTVLLADFVNATSEPVFDGTLKQALMVELQQTPFLTLLPDEAVRDTLRYMERPLDARVTRDVGREICQRQRLKAMIVGTIASLGSHYVITLEAINGQTGGVIASQQAEAEGKERVLTALQDAARGFRGTLGESRTTLHKYDVPIEQATTVSLDALKAYSSASDLFFIHGDARGALPLLVRATELDPNFALAHDELAWVYVNLGDLSKAVESTQKAFALRDRVSEYERWSLTDTYYHWATGDWDKEDEQNELAKRLYPNDWGAPHGLAINYTSTGKDGQAVAEEHLAIRLNPNAVHTYRFLAIAFQHLNRFDEAREVIQQARARSLDGVFFRRTLYQIAVAQQDAAAMQQQLAVMREKDGEREALLWQARTAAFDGRWRASQELFRRATAVAGAPGRTAPPPDITVRAAAFGSCDADAASQAFRSRVQAPGSAFLPAVRTDGSLCGDSQQGADFVDHLTKQYPSATVIQRTIAPVVHAAIALARNHPDVALMSLDPAPPSDEGGTTFVPTYLRGQAFLRLEKGKEAADEFRRILQHQGWDPTSVLYPLAQLGLARALALTGDATGARTTYQEFLSRWKDADADLPVVIEAKEERARLN